MTDSRADGSRFDPRFDPAFQPGYDAGSDPSIAARQVPERYDAPPSQVVPPGPLLSAGDLSSPPRPASRPAQPDDLDDESIVDPEEHDTPARGPNPFTVLLWVLSAVLIATGIALYRSIPGLEQQNLGFGDQPATGSFSQVFAVAMLTAMLITSGILIAVGNLFVLAQRWSRRNE